jgi:hypothetical protein
MVAALRGVNFSTLRYEVLTGGAPALSALAIVALVYGGWQFRYLLYSALLGFLIFVSITRTHLFVIAVMLGALLIAAPFRALTQRSLLRAMQIAPLLLLTVLAVDTVFPVSQLDRWWDRLVSERDTHRGVDITEITRLGEASYQFQQLEESTVGLLIGFGPAAQTQFDDQARTLVTFIIGNNYGSLWRSGGFGHNNYVGTFFVGGIIAGTILLLSQFLALFQVPGLLRYYSRMDRGEERLLMLSIPTALVGYMAIGVLSGTMGARSSAALLAASIALVWWLKSHARSQLANAAPSHPLPLGAVQPTAWPSPESRSSAR